MYKQQISQQLVSQALIEYFHGMGRSSSQKKHHF